MDVFALQEEARVPSGNPHRYTECIQTPSQNKSNPTHVKNFPFSAFMLHQIKCPTKTALTYVFKIWRPIQNITETVMWLHQRTYYIVSSQTTTTKQVSLTELPNNSTQVSNIHIQQRCLLLVKRKTSNMLHQWSLTAHRDIFTLNAIVTLFSKPPQMGGVQHSNILV